MATTFHLSSSSSTNPAPLSSHKLRDRPFNGVLGASSVSTPSSLRKTSLLPIRCRFSRPYRNHSYSSRRAGVGSNLEATSTGVPTSVPVRVALELLQAGHRYLDVRTQEEFSGGHVPGSVNIPYLFRVGSGMAKNPNFLQQVSSQFGKDDEILIGCQSGKRSLMAASDLQSAGYTGIMDIAGGYAAWTQSELPIEI